MKHGMKGMVAALILASSTALAGNEIRCQGTLSTWNKEGSKLHKSEGRLDPAEWGRTLSLDFPNGYRATIALDYEQKGSRWVPGAGVLSIGQVDWIQKKSQSKASVIFLDISTPKDSDQISNPDEVNRLKKGIYRVDLTLVNPQMHQVIARYSKPISPRDAMELGLVPEDLANDLVISCQMGG